MDDDFAARRERGNAALLRHAGLPLKRYMSLDAQVYEAGALPRKMKELLGLVASLVLRCDDCVTYHVRTCREQGVTGEELTEALSVAAVVGGTITIPHLRRAFEAWEAGGA
jgi:AhpD family alkylhydroperoxidase